MSAFSTVIVAAKRTPMGSFMGELSTLTAPQLGAEVIRAVTTNIDHSGINEVIMGCVLPAGLGQAPARQAALMADLPQSVGALTINKVCGSGLKAVMLAHDMIQSGNAQAIVAGGMESMSNAPYLLPKARQGYRMGHGSMLDHMFIDGLENAYDGQSMGTFAQAKADEEHITRLQMDDFALQSLAKAQAAQEQGAFAEEITPVSVTHRHTIHAIQQDEGPRTARPDKIPHLKPAFAKDGTVTAANSSSISDGAAALLLMHEATAIDCALNPIARVVAHSTHAMAPEDFTVAPIGAIKKLLDTLQWNVADVDIFEINEAFAMVTMAAITQLGIDEDKVNVNGGACALGHPIGASGARILVTLVHALKARQLSKGIATLCIGGGEAVAVAIEII